MGTLKHHHLKFLQAPSGGGAAEWEAEVKKLKGIDKVSIDVENKDVFIEYDLFDCREEDIERRMEEAGFVLDNSLRERLKRGWLHFTEQNEQDALKARPHSCCDVEDIEQERKDMK